MNGRYNRERDRMELALSMIEHEARTSTIRCCTGLSDDRIRKLCTQYFTSRSGKVVHRRRGKSPQRISKFVKNAAHQLEATTLLHLFLLSDLIRADDAQRLSSPWRQPDVAYGQSLCRAFETYQTLHEQPLLTFEWAWNLLQVLSRDEELAMLSCHRCQTYYLHDRYALDFHVCPACEIRTEQRRRPGARRFAGTTKRTSAR